MEQSFRIVINSKASRVLIILLVSIGFFSVDAVGQNAVNERARFIVNSQESSKQDKKIISGSVDPSNPLTNRELKNNILPSFILPDKLAIPERDNNYKSFSGKRSKNIRSKEQLKERMLEIDYYSKGIDGYYKKSIDMGYVGEGWSDTKELREAMGRVKSEISRNLGVYESTDPEFLKNMNNSSSSAVRALGSILNFLNNGGKKNCYLPDSPGYRGSNPIVPTVATPRRYKYVDKWD